MTFRRQSDRAPLALLALLAAVFAWSAWHPHDWTTWALEAAPAVIGTAVLAATYRRFRLSSLLYVLIFLHCAVLLIGAKYTYAEVPLFDWLKDAFDLGRNNYDKVGHFAQGFVPAMIAREVILRCRLSRGRFWPALFSFAICMTISAFYEIFEWFAAVALGQGADAFLGTQGYEWDTQSDMLFCGIGAFCSLAFLSPLHDRSLRALRLLRWEA